MLTLRGVAFGAAMFALLMVAFAFLLYRSSARAVHLMPGQQIGFDVRSLAVGAVQNPMFWITFIVMAAIGSALVNFWKH